MLMVDAFIQDMGYYPFSSKLFSDLTHYVRSGDFVTALISESQDLDEYAFALGALAHYAADNNGHRLGTNRRGTAFFILNSVPSSGKTVTYWDNPHFTHPHRVRLRTCCRSRKGAMPPRQYHAFIGFKASAKQVLERAFQRHLRRRNEGYLWKFRPRVGIFFPV